MSTNPWPSAAERISFYGNPAGANGTMSQAWHRANIVPVEAPWALRYNGQPTSAVAVHRKVAPSLARIFAEIWKAAGESQKTIDAWGMSALGGGFAFRMIRGTAATLSSHAFGAAVDFDPARNAMGAPSGHFQTVQPVLDAFAREHVFWGGNFKRRKDWMHWEWVRYD